MNNIQMRVLFGAIIMIATIYSSLSSAALLLGEGITTNSNGDYIITYMDPEEQQLVHVLYVPPNKIKPVLRSNITLHPDWTITYRYTVTNLKSSPQPLAGLTLDPVSSIKLSVSQQDLSSLNNDALFIPAGWIAFAINSDTEGYRANWIYKNLYTENDGLQPGQTQAGFGFTSLDLPGVQIAQLDGQDNNPSFSEEAGSEIIALYDQLMKDTSFVPRNAAVPTITVPDPFDAAVTLERIQAQAHTWIAKSLLDPVFSSQLDRSFQSAISAYRLNQPRVGKQEIQTIRELLRKEQPDLGRDEEHESDNNREKNDDRKSALIDRLAAKVLDFDLEYVAKRAGGDKGD